jgi:hypothetical protein
LPARVWPEKAWCGFAVIKALSAQARAGATHEKSRRLVAAERFA